MNIQTKYNNYYIHIFTNLLGSITVAIWDNKEHFLNGAIDYYKYRWISDKGWDDSKFPNPDVQKHINKFLDNKAFH